MNPGPSQGKAVVIRFFASIDAGSINALLGVIDQKLAQGVTQITLLISSPGGSVFHGLSAYNFLKGIPAQVITVNFGSVDSIGVILYCAGSRRLSVPNARFMVHGVSLVFQANERLEEPQIEERLKGVRIDMQNIAKVIAANTGRTETEVTKAMLDRTTLTPEEAKAWGLVHEIKSELFDSGAEVISIQSAS